MGAVTTHDHTLLNDATALLFRRELFGMLFASDIVNVGLPLSNTLYICGVSMSDQR